MKGADNKMKGYSSGYDYFFVRPGSKEDVHKTAKRLMGIKQVREVVITEGDYGFIVKADSGYGQEQSLLGRKITRMAGGSSRTAMCYCEYSKK